MMLDCFKDRALESLRLALRAKNKQDRELFLALTRAFYGTADSDSNIQRVPKVRRTKPRRLDS